MIKDEIRKAVVAGQFYPASRKELTEQIASFIPAGTTQLDCLACMLPHAGYMYSGSVAVETVSRIRLPENIILLGPTHTGYGAPFSVMTHGAWHTPLGETKINEALAELLLKSSGSLQQDSLAHLHEHSLEVQLPILQYFRPDCTIIPIVLAHDTTEKLKEIGKEIARALKTNAQEKTLIIASSDMTHYEPLDAAQKKDSRALEAISALDGDALSKVVHDLRISMCGVAPVIAMLAAVKDLGGTGGRIVKYLTSAEATKDTSSVVGYAGMLFS